MGFYKDCIHIQAQWKAHWEAQYKLVSSNVTHKRLQQWWEERERWWSGMLSLNMYIGSEETHHCHCQALTYLHRYTQWHKHVNAWQFPGELTTLDWWCRQSSICFANSLSLLSISLSYSHCFTEVCLDQSLISLLLFSLFPSHLLILPPPMCPSLLRYITGKLHSTWIHLAQWGLNKCMCQTQMVWSHCCGGKNGGLTLTEPRSRRWKGKEVRLKGVMPVF